MAATINGTNNQSLKSSHARSKMRHHRSKVHIFSRGVMTKPLGADDGCGTAATVSHPTNSDSWNWKVKFDGLHEAENARLIMVLR
jgi:hypothetical protein